MIMEGITKGWVRQTGFRIMGGESHLVLSGDDVEERQTDQEGESSEDDMPVFEEAKQRKNENIM